MPATSVDMFVLWQISHNTTTYQWKVVFVTSEVR